MRKKIIAGNWKMNLSFDDARQLLNELRALKFDDDKVEVLVAPPALYLSQFSFANASGAKLMAQNCHDQDSGAYTGEHSASMLASLNIDYCIVGHSERRSLFHESDEWVAAKVKACLRHQIIPIVCCGETLEERENRAHFDRITDQLNVVFTGMDRRQAEKIVIAYEPIWAIGTGKTASSAQAQEMHAFIRNLIRSNVSREVAENMRILYGGSMKGSNAAELLAQPDVDGGLVGGASLDYSSFKEIIDKV
jgi:triosephosphate isomerase (TIM)